MIPAHCKEPGEVASFFNSNLEDGLKDEQVTINRGKHGKNVVPPPETESIFEMILEQFKDPTVLILLGAVVLGFVFAFLEEDPEERVTAFIEPFVIILILAINSTIAVIQDLNARASVEALKAYQPNLANVIRNGQLLEISAEDLVCGDLVEVSEGKTVPADCRIVRIKSSMLKIDESMLTGESVPATKFLESVKEDSVISQMHCIAFSGTPVERGGFFGIVFAVGVDSKFGNIQKTVQETEERTTPLQEKLEKFGTVISYGIMVICAITWVSNIHKFKDAGHGSWIKGALTFFKIAISLAVAAIPEGLPAVVTMTLSLGVNRMAKLNAIVTKLPAVETLGCTSVICSDKTGTLTTNNMVVRVFSSISNGYPTEFQVEGDSYEPSGFILANGERVTNLHEHRGIQKSAFVGTTCNDASLLIEKGKFIRKGEPTDAALKVFAEKVGLLDPSQEQIRLSKPVTQRYEVVSEFWNSEFPKKRTHEFTRARKSMSCIVGNDTLVIKGAFEVILNHCTHYMEDMSGDIRPITAEIRNRIDSIRSSWSHLAYRCIGLAYKKASDYESWDIIDQDKLAQHETGLIWVGSVGIYDPPRKEVIAAIADCYKADIRVIMCTGDNPETATAIAQNIGMLPRDCDTKGKVFTGNEWKSMTENERENAAKTAVVLARVEPEHKRQLVGILQKQEMIVAMTGDGVNDAPALKAADIGIAMGSGTTVAQNAAQMILADDAFSTIVTAIREGRAIYNNTTAFIRYLLTCNIGEVVCCFVSSIIGGPNLLRSTQLLFVNLVTDGLPATALGVNPSEPNVMDLPPRPKNEEIVTKTNLVRYLLGGVYLGFATIAAAYFWYIYDPSGPHLTFKQVINYLHDPSIHHLIENDTPSTMAMSVLVVVEMFSAMTAVSEHLSIFTMPPWKNMKLVFAIIGSVLIHIASIEFSFTQKIFSVVHLNSLQWTIVLTLGLPVLIIEEIFKLYLRTTQSHEHHNVKL